MVGLVSVIAIDASSTRNTHPLSPAVFFMDALISRRSFAIAGTLSVGHLPYLLLRGGFPGALV